MVDSAKVTSKNQITIPASVRRSLGVQAGDKLDFIAKGGGVFELRARRESFADLRGILQLPQKVSADELDRWVADARDAGYREGDE
ncbi:AbrB/MazE/SpoVT family DNA-binding domain-containing protein [Rhizobium sp. OAE497]|uniref:AbrB/MazE/SpoVT family DNA-binding domain-containing protein n=1 Tax=Rhizobium sp. OAE497 TaxID=2663796 RepID=UPI0018F3CBAA